MFLLFKTFYFQTCFKSFIFCLTIFLLLITYMCMYIYMYAHLYMTVAVRPLLSDSVNLASNGSENISIAAL